MILLYKSRTGDIFLRRVLTDGSSVKADILLIFCEWARAVSNVRTVEWVWGAFSEKLIGFDREVWSLETGDWTGLEINLAGGWPERSVVQCWLIYPCLVRDGRLANKQCSSFVSCKHKRNVENFIVLNIRKWEGITSWLYKMPLAAPWSPPMVWSSHNLEKICGVSAGWLGRDWDLCWHWLGRGVITSRHMSDQAVVRMLQLGWADQGDQGERHKLISADRHTPGGPDPPGLAFSRGPGCHDGLKIETELKS